MKILKCGVYSDLIRERKPAAGIREASLGSGGTCGFYGSIQAGKFESSCCPYDHHWDSYDSMPKSQRSAKPVDLDSDQQNLKISIQFLKYTNL